MKTIRTILITAIIFAAVSPVAKASPEFSFEMPAITSTATLTLPDAATAPVRFDGGAIIGAVTQVEESGHTKIILTGASGFVFEKGHTGGILSIKFAKNPSTETTVTLKQFPRLISPGTFTLDGSDIEIQIAPSQAYLYFVLMEAKKIELSEVKFTPGAVLSDPVQCKCKQIKVTDTLQYFNNGVYKKMTK